MFRTERLSSEFPPTRRDERDRSRGAAHPRGLHGNLCRSPLGAALLRSRLERHDVAAEVTSVGLDAPMGRSPDRKLQRVASDLGVEVSGHQSRPVSDEHLRWAELILTMTGEQTAQLHRLDPTTEGRTATLRSAAWRAGLLPRDQLPFADWVARLAADVPRAERAQYDTSSYLCQS